MYLAVLSTSLKTSAWRLAFWMVLGVALVPQLVLAQTDNTALTPAVLSDELFDPDGWYSTADFNFTWDLPEEVTAVAVELATSSASEPLTAYRPPIADFAIEASELAEGVQYLLVQFRDVNGWGKVTAVPIKIDNTPPESFSIDMEKVAGEPNWFDLNFKANDHLSGVAYYQIYIGDRPAVTVSAESAATGYRLKNQEEKSHYIHVVAYDQAGNGTASSLAVLQSSTHTEGLFLGRFSPEPLLIALLSTIVLILFGYLLAERRRYAKEEERLQIEVEEIQIQTTKIFKALRDEIYDQVRTITKKPKLTKSEKEAVGGLNKAIEVSEALLEKEVKDVKRLLK